jgi:ubiquinone biosynthesis protein
MFNFILFIFYLPFRFLTLFFLFFLCLLHLFFRLFVPKSLKKPVPVILKFYLEKAGGTFIKAGQILAMRPDFLPVEYCEIFSTLFDNVKPFRSSRGIKIIEKELKKSADEIFYHIDPQPVAAASFGQVYKAEDREGNHYAVKVMRPGIERAVYADTFFLKIISFLLTIFGVGSRLGISFLVDEITDIFKQELDYISEIMSIKLSWIASKKVRHLRVPRVYEHLSTRRVITMEFLSGIWLKDILADLRKHGRDNLYHPDGKKIDTCVICRHIFTIGMQQTFEHGFFHADPHAGNILIMPDNEIGYIDYGLMGWLDSRFRRKQLDYFKALVNLDIDEVLDIFLSMLIPHNKANIIKFKQELKPILQLWVYSARDKESALSEKSTTRLLLAGINMARKYHFHFPLHVIRYYKSLLTTEPILLQLDPHYDVISLLKSYFIRYSIREYHSLQEKAHEQALEWNLDIYRMIMAIPSLFAAAAGYFKHVQRMPVTIKKGLRTILRFLSEVFFFMGILVVCLWLFFNIVNYGALFGLPVHIDFRFLTIVFFFLGYRFFRFSDHLSKQQIYNIMENEKQQEYNY